MYVCISFLQTPSLNFDKSHWFPHRYNWVCLGNHLQSHYQRSGFATFYSASLKPSKTFAKPFIFCVAFKICDTSIEISLLFNGSTRALFNNNFNLRAEFALRCSTLKCQLALPNLNDDSHQSTSESH